MARGGGLHLLPQVLIVDGLASGRAEIIGQGHPHHGSGGCVRRREEKLHDARDESGAVGGVACDVGGDSARAHGGQLHPAQRRVVPERARGAAHPRHDQQFAPAHASEWR